MAIQRLVINGVAAAIEYIGLVNNPFEYYYLSGDDYGKLYWLKCNNRGKLDLYETGLTPTQITEMRSQVTEMVSEIGTLEEQLVIALGKIRSLEAEVERLASGVIISGGSTARVTDDKLQLTGQGISVDGEKLMIPSGNASVSGEKLIFTGSAGQTETAAVSNETLSLSGSNASISGEKLTFTGNNASVVHEKLIIT